MLRLRLLLPRFLQINRRKQGDEGEGVEREEAVVELCLEKGNILQKNNVSRYANGCKYLKKKKHRNKKPTTLTFYV